MENFLETETSKRGNNDSVPLFLAPFIRTYFVNVALHEK